jgi:hypothetical protein
MSANRSRKKNQRNPISATAISDQVSPGGGANLPDVFRRAIFQ